MTRTHLPFPHSIIVENSLQVRSRHHDSVKPMASANQKLEVSTINSDNIDERDVPVMHIAHVRECDHSLHHQVPQVFHRRPLRECRAAISV